MHLSRRCVDLHLHTYALYLSYCCCCLHIAPRSITEWLSNQVVMKTKETVFYGLQLPRHYKAGRDRLEGNVRGTISHDNRGVSPP